MGRPRLHVLTVLAATLVLAAAAPPSIAQGPPSRATFTGGYRATWPVRRCDRIALPSPRGARELALELGPRTRTRALLGILLPTRHALRAAGLGVGRRLVELDVLHGPTWSSRTSRGRLVGSGRLTISASGRTGTLDARLSETYAPRSHGSPPIDRHTVEVHARWDCPSIRSGR